MQIKEDDFLEIIWGLLPFSEHITMSSLVIIRKRTCYIASFTVWVWTCINICVALCVCACVHGGAHNFLWPHCTCEDQNKSWRTWSSLGPRPAWPFTCWTTSAVQRNEMLNHTSHKRNVTKSPSVGYTVLNSQEEGDINKGFPVSSRLSLLEVGDPAEHSQKERDRNQKLGLK